MPTVLITGATDGLGLETAQHLASLEIDLILHGRNPEKLAHAVAAVEASRPGSVIATELADLGDLHQVDRLASALEKWEIDVVVNNAGILRTSTPISADGLDIRFAVNTIAPYLLTRRLLPSLATTARVVNLSSAAQAPVSLEALAGGESLNDMEAYAQSKLAITMWSKHLADELGAGGPAIIAVNPGSLLATKMVKEGYGVSGNDIRIGIDILTRAALSDEFADASGRYFDNDSGRFAQPHPDALDPAKNTALVAAVEHVIDKVLTP